MSQNFSFKQFFTKMADISISFMYVVLMAVAIVYIAIGLWIA